MRVARYAGFVLVFGLGAADAIAQVPRGVPDGAQPQGLSCRQGPGPAPGAAPLRKTGAAEACWISAPELLAMSRGTDAVFVDVRRPSDFGRFHIDGALNLPAAHLKSKTYLKQRKIVLVGDGKDSRDLLLRCSELRQEGFAEARVLRGGMMAWLAGGGGVAGRAPPLLEMAKLSPVELAQILEGGNAQIVVERKGPFSEAFPGAIAVRSFDSRSLKALRTTGDAPTILVSGAIQPNEYAALAETLEPLFPFVYTSGLHEYQAARERQRAIWAAQTRPPKRPPCS